jgi:ribosome-binding protein aMBF1 (putative translation factor)
MCRQIFLQLSKNKRHSGTMSANIYSIVEFDGVVEMSSLAENVRRYRQERAWSVRQLAAKAGVSVSYIYAIESGVRGSNLVKLAKVAQALEVSLSALWDEGSS